MSEPIRETFSSVTGAQLEKCLWPADGEAKAVVQLVHGMAEHIDRYDGVAKRLNAAGYAVAGHTHLGHGKNAPIKGYFTDENGWDALIDDTHALRKQTQEQFPGLPYFLLGHSMGSFVVRTYCLRYEEGLQGVILSGTGHFARPIVTAGSVIASLQCALGMAKKPSKLLHRMNFSANNRQVENPRTDSDWLSRDAEQVDRYIADPLCGFMFTARAYRDLFTGLKRLYPDRIGAMKKDIPILVFSGDRDPVGGNGEGVREVVGELKAAGVEDVTLKLYEDARHEILNELNRDEVYHDLIQWMNERLAR